MKAKLTIYRGGVGAVLTLMLLNGVTIYAGSDMAAQQSSAVARGSGSSSMPCPFSRLLEVESPMLEGQDVYVLRNLLQRSVDVYGIHFDTSLVELCAHVSTCPYDETTESAVKVFQKAAGLSADGIVGANTATELLRRCSG